jgi:hypothetical protein
MFLSTLTSLLDRFPFVGLFLVLLFDADVAMHPVYFVLLAFVGICALLVGLSLGVLAFVGVMHTHCPFVVVVFSFNFG